MRLKEALRIDNPISIALVGAGGKTSTLFNLGKQLGQKVILATSTHLAVSEARLADRHVILGQDTTDETISSSIVQGVTLFTGNPIADNFRIAGLSRSTLDKLWEFAKREGYYLIVEADGSRRLPVKAPADHEPPIPSWVDLVLVSIGLSGLGNPVDEEHVFRTEQYLALSGLKCGQKLDCDSMVKVLTHPKGGLKNIPKTSRRSVILNQVDTQEQFDVAGKMAKKLLNAYDTVVVNSYQTAMPESDSVKSVYEKIAGIILAGGESRRYGVPKALLDWDGKPLIRHVVETALRSGLDPVVVVLGAVDQPIRGVLTDLPVHFVLNTAWENGQSTSVAAGIEALEKYVGGAIILMADQPQIPVELIHSLMAQHYSTRAQIIAPVTQGHRSSPVLMDRKMFDDLKMISGDTGGRAIFNRHSVLDLQWDNPDDLFDIDTPDDYQHLLELNKRP